MLAVLHDKLGLKKPSMLDAAYPIDHQKSERVSDSRFLLTA
jgi:hypothetical protein